MDKETNVEKPFIALIALAAATLAFGPETARAQTTAVFEEADGVVAVEAEHFIGQGKTEVRKWYLTTPSVTPDIKPDPDPNHSANASGNAYLEILPDTRVTHSDPIVSGVSFSNVPGEMTIVSYKVHLNKTGRYYVWVRGHVPGPEDNGLHVGIDGTWPTSGARMQWCGFSTWAWTSMQRTEANHCGEAGKIFLDVKEAGEHTVMFSMREDGFEMDKWMMTTSTGTTAPEGMGPGEKPKSGSTGIIRS